jgi:microcin C transport system permease protein
LTPPDLPASDPAARAATGASLGLAPPAVLPFASPTFLGRKITPLTRRRIDNFRANRRGFWSLWIFLVAFAISLFAELIVNDLPLLIRYDGAYYMPVFHNYPETTFGGFFPSEAKYSDPEVQQLIEAKGWIVWPLIPFRYDSVTTATGPFPAAPSVTDWLGTDDQGRDVVARLIYGFRISVLFGLVLTVFSSLIGVAAGAVQGYFGGIIDLGFQRFIEVWSGLPILYLLIILASIVQLRHVLPNAMVATITFMPFILNTSITTLTALDFLGFGLPAGSPSLGELLAQGKANLQAPWLGITSFLVLAIMLTLLTFVGEAVRDAFDPRKVSA